MAANSERRHLESARLHLLGMEGCPDGGRDRRGCGYQPPPEIVPVPDWPWLELPELCVLTVDPPVETGCVLAGGVTVTGGCSTTVAGALGATLTTGATTTGGETTGAL